MKYTIHIAIAAFLFVSVISESCKTHKKDQASADALAQQIADSLAASAAIDSMFNLPEYEVDAKSMESENRYNASAKRVNDILNTKLEVSFNFATAQLNGKATIDIQPYFYATDSLLLDAKSFDIEKVAMLSKEGAMSDLNFKYDSAQIHIGLGKMFSKNETYRIFIQYKANPNKVKNASSAAITDAKGLYFIDNKEEDDEKPTQVWTQGETESNSCWFPTIDKPN
jgi:aminopeptidase N